MLIFIQTLLSLPSRYGRLGILSHRPNNMKGYSVQKINNQFYFCPSSEEVTVLASGLLGVLWVLLPGSSFLSSTGRTRLLDCPWWPLFLKTRPWPTLEPNPPNRWGIPQMSFCWWSQGYPFCLPPSFLSMSTDDLIAWLELPPTNAYLIYYSALFAMNCEENIPTILNIEENIAEQHSSPDVLTLLFEFT